MTPPPPRPGAPGKITAPDAPPFERRRSVPADWTHNDTINLSTAHALIATYTGLFSAEFDELLKDPMTHAERIAAIKKNDLIAESDVERLASFDRTVIAAIIKKYTRHLANARALEAAANT